MRNQIFNQALLPAPSRNYFDMSYSNRLSADEGLLIPFHYEVLVPGDTFKGEVLSKIRTLPLVAPVFEQFTVSFHFYAVAPRLLRNNKGFEDFFSNGRDGETPSPPPYMTAGNFYKNYPNPKSDWYGVNPQSLADYLGLPVVECPQSSEDPDVTIYNFSSEQKIDLTPFLAYQMVYDEYYRDENIIPEVFQPIMDYVGDGGNMDNLPSVSYDIFRSLVTLRNRAFRKDVFTSALPLTQHGKQVIIPLGPVNSKIPLQNFTPKFLFTGAHGQAEDTFRYVPFKQLQGGTIPADATAGFLNLAVGLNDGTLEYYSGDTDPKLQVVLGGSNGSYVPFVDLDGMSGLEVNAVRSAMMQQAFYERLEVCGSRYTEIVRGLFGVYSSDARLQRPEAIGGGSVPLLIGDVLQSEPVDNENDNKTPAGTLRGAGMALADRGIKFSYRATEHMIIIGIMSIMPRQAYFQGIPRRFTRLDRFDWFWPLLSHQGEEPIKNSELYWDPDDDESNEGTFGYMARYADWRSRYDEVHGMLAVPDSGLDVWHSARFFGNTPTLSQQFIENQFYVNGLDRIFPVDAYPGVSQGYFICDIFIKQHAWRPMPRFATPATL